jgi:hypothetical protein
LPIGRETETFEPVDQVVSEKDQMKIGLIGSPISGGDFAQGIGFEEFSNDEFSRGSLIVKTPEIQGLQREIGDDHMVGIASHLEKRELPGGLVGNKTPHHDEALSGFPSPRFVFELGHPEPGKDLLVMQTSKASLNRFGDSGHNGIERRDSLKILGNCMVVEGRIGSYTDLSNTRGQLGDAFFQNLDGVRSWMDIAREIDSFPDIARLSFETEKGLIRGPSPLLRIEPHSGSLLLSIDSENFGIEVEDYGGERIGFHEKMASESIVEVLKGCQPSRAKPFQKPPQGGRIWISGKTGQILEDTILLQQGVGFDPS